MEDSANSIDSRKRDPEGIPKHASNLQSQLFNSFQREENYPSFLPIDALDRLITKDAVMKELKECWLEQPLDTLDKIASDICRRNVVRGRAERLKFSSCQRLFALLVLCGQVQSVTSILAQKINDEDLPFTRQENGDSLYSSKTPEMEITMFNAWSPAYINVFEELQWKLLAPYFSTSTSSSTTEVRHYDLQARDILPRVGIRQQDSERIIKMVRSESRVEIYKLHPGHHDFQLPNEYVRVQKYSSVADALSEIKIFKSVNQRNDRRTIKLLATFSVNDTYYLMFPAAYSSLGDFWQDTTPTFSKGTMLWLAQESCEIAKGLSRIHYPTEYPKQNKRRQYNHKDVHLIRGADSDHSLFLHADITPMTVSTSNVSKSTDHTVGYLKLVISSVHEFHPSFEKGLFELPPRASRTWRPPETEIATHCGLNYDTWALGCLYLEGIIWIFEGWDGVDRFSRQRLDEDRNLMNRYFRPVMIPEDKFFTCLKEPSGIRTMVKPVVTQWISNLHAHHQCTEYLHDFLDYIQHHMLVIEKKDRDESFQVASMMRSLKKKQKETGDDYILKPAPRPPSLDLQTEFQPAEILQPMHTARLSDFKTENDYLSEGSSVASSLFSSGSDKENQSKGIYSSTMATSQDRPKAKTIPPATSIIDDVAHSIEQGSHSDDDHVKIDSRDIYNPEVKAESTDDWDAETTYSLDQDKENSQAPYIQVFTVEIAKYLKDVVDVSEFAWENFDLVLKQFAWRLHGESSNPFQWEAAVTLHQQRAEIMRLLTSNSWMADRVDGSEDSSSEEEYQPFNKDPDMIHRWISDVDPSIPVTEALDGLFSEQNDGNQNMDTHPALSQLSEYDKFIRQSEAYKWFQSKVQQHHKLCTEHPDLMLGISERIQAHLRTYGSLRKISHRRPLSFVQISFNLDWNPGQLMHARFENPSIDVLNQIYCLTGSENAVQFTTVLEYMHQTWPETVEPIINLLQQLITRPEGQECSYQLPVLGTRPGLQTRPRTAQLTACIKPPDSCSISVTGDRYFVSEIAEQIGWLASTLRLWRGGSDIVACYPYVDDIRVWSNEEAVIALKGSCNIRFDFKEELKVPRVNAVLPIFCSRILVRGYPVLRKSEADSILDVIRRGESGNASLITNVEEYWKQVCDTCQSSEMNDCLSDLNNLRLIPYNSSHSLSVFSKWRVSLEDYLECGEIDWYPLPPIDRLPSVTQAKLAWTYGNKDLSIILSEDEIEPCSYAMQKASDGQSTLPPPVQSNGERSPSTFSRMVHSVKSCLLQRRLNGSMEPEENKPNTPSQTNAQELGTYELWSDSFVCVSKAWRETEETTVRAIKMLDVKNDYDFYIKTMKALQDAQGGWLERLVSWKSFNTIDFKKFFYLFDDMDLVLTTPSLLSDCTQYEYSIQHGFPEDVHMRMIGAMILAGIRNPQIGRDSQCVIRGIPKRPAPPKLQCKHKEYGWAFHPKYGLCLRRNLYWVNGIVVLGIAFVPFWLGAINKLDLQNAFAPVTFLGMMVTLWLTISVLGNVL